MADRKRSVTVLGVYVADLTSRAPRLPRFGETIRGTGFAVGPGGKGSNQAVAVARLGVKATLIAKLGQDQFGASAKSLWAKEGVETHLAKATNEPTGTAFVIIDDRTGDSAVIVNPGAGASLSPADVDEARVTIESSAVFMTGLEIKPDVALRGLEIARAAGVATLFNPSPDDGIVEAALRLTDYVIVNEIEAEAIAGTSVRTIEDARRAADILIGKGAGAALVTLGSLGALLHTPNRSLPIPVVRAGQVVDTTGAGDAFSGGFAAALARGIEPARAAYFGSTVAGIAVTRQGGAPSMPRLAEVEALIAKAA
jgi:ribokinase